MSELKIGDRVRFSTLGKRVLSKTCASHFTEFKNSKGTIIEDLGKTVDGRQIWDVRWDERLKYAYYEAHLEVL